MFEVVVGGAEKIEVVGGGGAAELFVEGVVEVAVAGCAVAPGEAAGSVAELQVFLECGGHSERCVADSEDDTGVGVSEDA